MTREENRLDLQKALISTGLTGYEARLYVALLAQGRMSGYEAAKASGISRSNVYVALEGLLEKGGAWREDGEVTRYVPVPVDEYCLNRSRALEQALDFIRAHAPERRTEPDAYITVSGDEAIRDKMRNMIRQASKRLYAALDAAECVRLMPELAEAVAHGKKVVLLTAREVTLPGAAIYPVAHSEPGRIRLITDSAYVLTGGLSSPRSRGTCLFTANPTLINLFKEAMKNEITLTEMHTAPEKEN